jgi:hypothetical protein
MPKRGLCSLTIRYEISRRGGELVSVRGLTVDEVVNELMKVAWEVVRRVAYAEQGLRRGECQSKRLRYIQSRLEQRSTIDTTSDRSNIHIFRYTLARGIEGLAD